VSISVAPIDPSTDPNDGSGDDMTTKEETRRVVEGYFAAWTRNDVDAAYALLADDLEFIGPSAHFQSAAAFRPGLVGFAAMTKSARVTDLLVDGDRAAMLYDCELPAPVGVLRIASFFRVENGKIRTYETQFDATEFRKLLARRAEGG
jgi:ketosteroid isomerase-like protein